MPQYIPPIVIVKTWLQLINFNTKKEVRDLSKRMINQNFGSVDLAIIYIEQNQARQKTKVLVETWLHLLTQNEDAELKERGKNMLLGAFENKQAVANYMKKHHIKV